MGTDSPMTDNGRVEVSTEQGIGTISFSHPKGNSLPGSILAELAAAVTKLGADNATKVIVLRSEGSGAFCAGASFSELQSIKDEAAGKKFFLGFAKLILAMIRCPKFIVTRVQGKTVGGGVGILAASDYTIATEGCSVRLSELAVGIGPFVVGPVIEKKIGLAAYSAMAVDAGWRHAAWARTHGLYSELHPTIEQVDTSVTYLTTTLAASNPEAMSKLKKVFWEGTESWEKLLDDRAAASGKLVLSDFAKSAIAAAGKGP
jgi:methylglutaconyl-CoA hydratase